MEKREVVLLKDIEIEGFKIPAGNYTLSENNMYYTLKYRHPMGMDNFYNVPCAIFKNHIMAHIVDTNVLENRVIKEGYEMEVLIDGRIRKYSVEEISPASSNGGTHYISMRLEAID